jgi:tetratricopeptide (TPR) repeat protein
MAAAGIEISSIGDEEALRPEILTDEEKRLIEAYDNYIRLFPDDENTPKYLANAGAIYFNHKQFAEARVYFKTLVNRFPGAREKTLAYRSIMDSYFYLGQFEDSEFIAKRILQSENIPDEERIFAQKRLAASIFNHAKLFEDQGQFMDAANEFRRVYAEAPQDTAYAEAGLFNSGRNYDKIKEWEKALDTYILLADSYPASKYTISALKNAAEDNKELKNFSDAAQIYERIYSRQISNPEEAEIALYNAAYYYKEGEDWNNAIRLHNQYIETYPENPLSTDFYFATAGFYLKLNNLTEANRIYAEFATKYPDDPRGVQAFYERGAYYQDNGQLGLAKAEYQKAIDKSESLNQKGMDPNRFYVGEALNKMVDMLYTEYMAIELRQPASNIESQQARMRGLITEISSNDLKIIANGSIRSFEAAYRNAEVYELFADKYLSQERNPNLSSDQKFVEDKKINDASAGLYDKAVDEYIKAMENIPIIAEKLDVDLFSVDTVETEIAADTLFSDTLGTVARATEVDSTKELGLKYYTLASSKISYLYYKEAEITKTNIDQAFATTNPYTDAYPAILFQAQLISKLINPAVEQTIGAHLKNIEEANTLNLSNKYVEESKRQILLTSNIPAEEVEKLAYLSLRDYSAQMTEYRRLVETEYGTVNAKGKDYPMIQDDVQQLIDVSKTLSITAMNSFAQTLQRAEEQGIQNDFVRTTEDRMMRIAVELTDKYDAYEDSAEYWQGYYQTRFDSTENYNYDDAFLFYQEQTFGFTDYEQEILDHAFQLKEQYDINNLWSNKVLAKLIAVDPATYAGAVEREKFIIESDENWLVSTTYKPGYNREDFDDSDWKQAGIVTSAYNQFIDLDVNPKAMWLPSKKVVVDTSQVSPFDTTFGMTDSLGLMDSTGLAMPDTTVGMDVEGVQDPSLAASEDMFADSLDSDTIQVYFRKKIDLKGTPVEGTIYITADNDFNFFLNEEYITDDELDNFAIIDTVDFGYLSYSVKPGINTLALRVTDTDRTGNGVKIYGFLELIPLDILAAMEERSKVEELNIDPAILKRINTLNKNRITVR